MDENLCPKCGATVSPTSHFCVKCGAPLTEGSKGESKVEHTKVEGGIDFGPDETREVKSTAPSVPGGVPLAGSTGPGKRSGDTIGIGDAQGFRAGGGVSGLANTGTGTEGEDEKPKKPKQQIKPIWIAAAVAACAAIAMLIFVFLPNIPGGGDSTTENPAEKEVVATDPVDKSDSGIDIYENLESYSWDDLSKISGEIAGAADEAAAIEIARSYNLVDENNKLDTSMTKSVEFSDGTKAHVYIAGFVHDEKSDGGKAGITFLFKECVGEHLMSFPSVEPNGYKAPSNSGGWRDSEMRVWLANNFAETLPDDLSKVMVKVNKTTNNSTAGKREADIGSTSDVIWLPSVVEVCGPVAWWENDRDNTLNGEGSQYKIYRDANINTISGNAVLQKSLCTDEEGESISWWYRSPTPSYPETFRLVKEDGTPSDFDNADDPNGVAPGFSI